MLIPVLLAVAVVAGVIAIVDLVHGSGGNSGGNDAVVGGPVVSTSAPSVSPSVPTTSSSAPATTSSAPAATSKPAPPKTTAPPAVATPAPAATTLQVFNVSRHSGLAQNEATRLRAAGYKVTRVANKTGVALAQTTVYYDPGNETEAAEARGVVARGLASATAPRPSTVAATGTLIVYVV